MLVNNDLYHKLDEFSIIGQTASDIPTATPRTLYIVPSACKMLYMFLQNAGASGGGGGADLSGSDVGGGGGGHAGMPLFALAPAVLMGKVIGCLIIAGVPGGTGQVQGGAAATAGTSGNASILYYSTPTAATGIPFLQAPLNAAAGNGGSATAGGAGGAGRVAASDSFYTTIRRGYATNSISAGAGGFGAAGGSITPEDGRIFTACAGAGGGGQSAGGIDYDGGSITDTGNIPSIPNIAGSSGQPGMMYPDLLKHPFYHRGGGGGASAATTGKRGGDGGIGSGGGGGGSGTGVGAVGGAGGNGGPGFLLITPW